MANDQLASGSVVVSANADRLASGLKKAEGEVKTWSSGLSKDLASDFSQEIGKRSFVGGILGGAAGGGLGGAFSEFVANGSAALLDMMNNAKGLADELDRVEKFYHALAIRNDAIAKDDAARLAAQKTAEDRLSEAQAQLRMLREEEEEMNAVWDEVKEKVDELNSNLSLDAWGKWLRGAHGPEMDAANKNLALQTELLEKNVARQRDLNKTVRDAQNEITAREAVETEKALADMEKRQADEFEKLQKAAADYADELDFALKTWGMTAEQIKLVKLEMMGLDEATIGAMRQRQEQLAALNMMKDLGAAVAGGAAGVKPGDEKALDSLAGAVEAGTAEGYSLSVKNRFSEAGMSRDAVHQENGRKLDDIEDTLGRGFKVIEDGLKRIGVL
jgi:hypothetical protein